MPVDLASPLHGFDVLDRTSVFVRPLGPDDARAARAAGMGGVRGAAGRRSGAPAERLPARNALPGSLRPRRRRSGGAARPSASSSPGSAGLAVSRPAAFAAGDGLPPSTGGGGFLAHRCSPRSWKHARNRGAAISTLFPTAPNVFYRRFGFEIIGGNWPTVEGSTDGRSGGGPARPRVLRARRAAVARLHDAVPRGLRHGGGSQNGPLTRRGPSFPASAEEFVSSFTGVTLAVDASDRVHGYASWQRGGDVGAGARLRGGRPGGDQS